MLNLIVSVEMNLEEVEWVTAVANEKMNVAMSGQ
jgi:hypothetical protein